MTPSLRRASASGRGKRPTTLHGEALMSAQNSNGNKKSKRRFFLKVGGALGLTGAVGGTALLTSLFPRVGRTQARHHHRTPVQTDTAAQRGLAKFVDDLPRAPTISPISTQNGVPFFDVKMRPLLKKLHRDLPATALWGYNGMFPPPTFETRRGKPINVKWENQLPGTHFLPIDKTIGRKCVPGSWFSHFTLIGLPRRVSNVGAGKCRSSPKTRAPAERGATLFLTVP